MLKTIIFESINNKNKRTVGSTVQIPLCKHVMPLGILEGMAALFQADEKIARPRTHYGYIHRFLQLL
jgi:hypothetical protein